MQHSHPSDEYPVQAFPEGFRMLVGNPYVRFSFFLSLFLEITQRCEFDRLDLMMILQRWRKG